MVCIRWKVMAESAELEAVTSDLLEQHKREVKDLRAAIQSLKKGIPKGDKKKKKEVTTEITRLEQELKEKHEREIQAASCDEVRQDMETLDLESSDSKRETGKKSKAQRRKDKRSQREKERDERIAETEAEVTADNPRLRERENLSGLLQPLGMAIKDIPPDGHCLYAAVSDQMSVRLGIKTTVSELRALCSDYIRSHSSDFRPYLTDPNTGDPLTDAEFDQYCTEVESTAAWGGHLEVRALSHVYKAPISIYQADAPMLCIGEEYNTSSSLCITYHRHEYGLGEHYNSTT